MPGPMFLEQGRVRRRGDTMEGDLDFSIEKAKFGNAYAQKFSDSGVDSIEFVHGSGNSKLKLIDSVGSQLTALEFSQTRPVRQISFPDTTWGDALIEHDTLLPNYPLMNFSVGHSNGYFKFHIGTGNLFKVADTGIELQGTNRRVTFDTNDQINYNTGTNFYEFKIGGASKFDVSDGGIELKGTWRSIVFDTGDVLTLSGSSVFVPYIGGVSLGGWGDGLLRLRKSGSQIWQADDNGVTLGGTNRRVTFDTNDYMEYQTGHDFVIFRTGGFQSGVLGNGDFDVLLNNTDLFKVTNSPTQMWLKEGTNDILYVDGSNLVFSDGAGNSILSVSSGQLSLTTAGGDIMLDDSGVVINSGTRQVIFNIGEGFLNYASKIYQFNIDNADRFNIAKTGITLKGTTRKITFDDTDYLDYASDTYKFYIGGADKFIFDDNGIELKGANRIITSDSADLVLQTTTSGDLSLNPVGNLLNKKADFYMGNGLVADSDQYIYFYDGASPTGQYFRWDDANNRFNISKNMKVMGGVEIGEEGAMGIIKAIGKPLCLESDTGEIELEPAAGFDVGIASGNLALKDNQSLFFDTAKTKSLTYSSANSRFEFNGGLYVTGGVGFRSSTLIVAASDSSDKGKAGADYVCPGTDDLDYITTTVIPALPASGGCITLLEGIYRVNTNAKPLTINTKSNITIKGQGKNTVLKLDSDEISRLIYIVNSNNIIIEDMYLDGTTTAEKQANLQVQSGIQISISPDCIVRNVTSCNNKHCGILIHDKSHRTVVENCEFLNNGERGITTVSEGTGCDYNIIKGNISNSNTIGICLVSSYNTVIGNIVRSNTQGIQVTMYMTDGVQNTINGNIVESNTANGIYLNNSGYNAISANIVKSNGQSGIYLYGKDNNSVVGNVITLNTYYGILLSATNSNTITGNTIRANSQGANQTYDNINMWNDSNYNNVQNNTVRKGGEANKPRYGVWVQTADCDDNLIRNNDLLDSGDVGILQDNGTGTVKLIGDHSSNRGV